MMWNNSSKNSLNCTFNIEPNTVIHNEAFSPALHTQSAAHWQIHQHGLSKEGQWWIVLPMYCRDSETIHLWKLKAFNWFTSKQHQHTVSILFLLPLFHPSSDWAIPALISGSGSLRAYFETVLDGTPNMWSVDQCAPTTFMPKPLYGCSQRENSTFIQDIEHRFGVKYGSYWLFASPLSQCQISTLTWLNRNKSCAHKNGLTESNELNLTSTQILCLNVKPSEAWAVWP